ncbi:ubiquinol-cytochrome c reductase iron-sulfur subunit, partial [Candidatus Enterovibrio escicola]
VAVPFISSWNPSSKAKAEGAPIEVDISKVREGRLSRVVWQGKPVWVVRRSEQTLRELKEISGKLRDPDSLEPQQPKYITAIYRSIKPELFVAVGICTHLGCSPTYLSVGFGEEDQGVTSGFFCPCHGSKFDMAGRVFQSVPAPLNLLIPPYTYINDNRIIVGNDEASA